MPTDPLTLVSPPLLSAEALRVVDRAWAATHPERTLMERAGAAAAELAQRIANDTGMPILILAGPGNNGGDALVAARLLKTQGYAVTLVSRADPARLPPDARRAWSDWYAAGGAVLADPPAADRRFSLVIDGLFGLGLQRDVGVEEARWLVQANALACPKLALDVPSGLDSDRGSVRGCAIRADHTLTFIALKPGLLTAAGRDHVGQLHLDTLGVAPALLPATPGFALTRLEPRHQLPARTHDSHKGDYGHVGIVGGAQGMVGACLIAGRAALEQGAGLVTLGVLDERVAVDYAEPRLMFASPEALAASELSVLAIGPGLGRTTRAHALVAAALSARCPLVLDADALNLLADDPELATRVAARAAPTVLTPHPGEAARLLGMTTGDVQADRIAAARRLSETYRATVALKGSGTVIARLDGRYAINTRGGPWLAQAGSGDRLTGMIAARLGQGMVAEDAVESAVWQHGGMAP